MMRYYTKSSVLLALLVLPAQLLIADTASTNSPTGLSPGPNDPRIAYVTARLLEINHYSQKPLDEAMSKRFFDNYLESLDPRRENFLQSDIDEFSHYRTNLDKLTITPKNLANLTPAFQIYQRYIERLQEHNEYVQKLLKADHFKFNGDDKLTIDRRDAPYPKNLEEAKQLWREQLRYQYLQEKLSRELTVTNGTIVLKPTNAVPAEIAETLAKHLRWNFHQTTNRDSTDVLQLYLEALAHAYDPHSDYFNTEHAQDFSINMSLSLVGIGAQLSEDDGYCTIKSLIRGGPAEKSKKLNEQDRIVAVAQGTNAPVNVVDMELNKVVQLIRGQKGTEVRLTISPADDRSAREVVTLVRDEIKLEDQEAKAQLIEVPNNHGGTNRIGVIDLPSFYATIDLPGSDDHSAKSTTADVTKLVKKLKQEKVDGIILDLRSNPGGSLEEAVRFTGLFIKHGPVVLARAPDGNVQMRSDNDPSELYDGPLAVLVNRFSASAAEIAAAALQDYGRAIVVGDTSTHGKGTVQNLNMLRTLVWPATPSATNDPGTVKITIQKFYRVSGASTQLKGVVPDIILPDRLNSLPDIGESSLEYPLPWDTINPARYDKLNLVAPYISFLRQHSEARTATNQDFVYVRQDIAQDKKQQEDKSITLNEQALIKERQTNLTRQKARDAEREARKPSGIKIYEITVKDSTQPGLPAPMPLTVTNFTSVVTTNAVLAKGTVAKNGSSHTDAAITNTAAGDNSVASTDRKEKTVVKNIIPLDPMLNETVNILIDYISLLSANHTLVAQ